VDSANAGGIHGLKDEHENTRVLAVSVDEAMDWLDRGKFNNAMTLIGMQWFKMNRQGVRERWRGA